MSDTVAEELWSKLKIDEFDPESEDPDHKIETFELNPHLEEESGQENEEEEEEDDDDDDEDFEFSFPCANVTGSPISADDAFHNGQIRTMFPLFDQSLLQDAAPCPSKPAVHEPLRKLFTAMETEGTAEEIKSVGGLGRKSNSTGSSRVWRFRDLVHRSSSDGKDAFVFLNHARGGAAMAVEKPVKRAEVQPEKKAKGKKVPPSSVAAHEKHYGKNRVAAEKRRSYLPYRPGLVGFFTNVNGLSRNVHPF